MVKLINSVPFVYKIVFGTLLMIGAFFVAMLFGAAQTTFHDVWLTLTFDGHSEATSILRDIRLPREIAAVFVGMALGVSGAIIQGITRNPLADPGLLGVTAGANAALAATLAFLPNANYFAIMI
ncbi:MAG TPA: iron chelate uptake ABC transporter family permease subunit, partial [Bacillales bacterium]|nr:iron chelate uptake ABC transporter family permease subunit [Bacillales bacterium]